MAQAYLASVVMGATAKEKKVNMKIIAKDNLIPVIKAGVEKANVDDANLTIEATNSEVRYSMEFPSEVNRQNMLNCACAISFLNWRYGEKENPCYYTYDEKTKKISVNLVGLIDVTTVGWEQIRAHVDIVSSAYGCTVSELDLLLIGLETGYEFKNDLQLPAAPYNIIAKDKVKSMLVDNFLNASKAFGGEGNNSGITRNTTLVGVALGDKENRRLTMRIHLREEKRVLTLTHLLPYGCELERGLEIAMAIKKINSKLAYGSFDFDLLHGRVVYRAGFEVSGSVIRLAKYKEIASLVTLLLQKYYPILVDYLKGQIKADVFIAKVDNV